MNARDLFRKPTSLSSAPLVLAVAAVLLLLWPARARADECGVVLASGADNTVVLQTKSSFATEATDWFCSDSFEKYVTSSSGSAGITVPIKGVPIGFKFGSDNSSGMEKRKQFCADSQRRLARKDALDLATSVGDEVKVNAWLECQRIKSARPTRAGLIDLTQEVTASGNRVIISARYNALPLTRAPKFRRLEYSEGISCTSAISAGDEITTDAADFLCKRVDKKAQEIFVVTDAGIFTVWLPAQTCGEPYGSVEVTQTHVEHLWVDDGTVSKTKGTGNHHCSRDCGGEPTRTNYVWELTVGEGEQLSDPKCSCIAGPCGGWWQIHQCTLSSVHRMYLSVDVWSKPTTWRLSANKKKRVSKVRSRTLPARKLTYGNTFVVSVPMGKAAKMKVGSETGDTVITVGDDGTELELEQSSRTETGTDYTYRVPCQ